MKSSGINASKDAKGELVIKITPALKKRIVEALKDKQGAITDKDIIEYVMEETHRVKALPEVKK